MQLSYLGRLEGWMSSPAGSEELVREATPAIHRLREHALDGERPRIGELRLESPEGPAVSCSIVVIAEIEGSFLVGVPQTAWHRTAGRRYLPRTALTRTVLAEVLAADGADPTNIRPGVKLKVWLGLLQPALEEHVDFGVDGALEPDVPFLGYGSRAQERLDPFGPSLSAIASEHFAFHTPAEEGAQDQGPAGEEAWEDRLTRLEAGMLKVQESMQLMLDGAPITDRRAPSGSGVGDIGPRPQASAKPHLAGLDPAVVEAARAAGIPEDQLTRMSQLATKGAKAPGAKAKAKAKLPLLPEDPLDESEDDVAAAEGGGALVEGSQPGAGAERKNDLEELLDRADTGGGEALGSGSSGSRSKSAAYLKLRGALRSSPELISGSIESLMEEDFTGAQSGPYQGERKMTVRGWLEHRSHLQSYAGPIRQGWTLATIVDLINAGSVEQAKATALLGIAALDQSAIDSGNWLLAAEFAPSPFRELPEASGLGCLGSEADAGDGPQMDLPLHVEDQGAGRVPRRKEEPGWCEFERSSCASWGRWRRKGRSRETSSEAAEGRRTRQWEGERQGQCKVKDGRSRASCAWLPTLGAFSSSFAVCQHPPLPVPSRSKHPVFGAQLPVRGAFSTLTEDAPGLQLCSTWFSPSSRKPQLLPVDRGGSSGRPRTLPQACSWVPQLFLRPRVSALRPRCLQAQSPHPREASCGLGPSSPRPRFSSPSGLGPRDKTSCAEAAVPPLPEPCPPLLFSGMQSKSPLVSESHRAPLAPSILGCTETRPPIPSSEFRQPSSSSVPDEAAASLSARPAQDPAGGGDAGPGARPRPVSPPQLWSDFFLCVSRAKCSLSAFFHSLRLLPRRERGPPGAACPPHQQGSRVWPMPLPYPEALVSGGTRETEQLGANAVVLVLDWLFLGQPKSVSKGLRLAFGEPLSPKQQEAVASLRLGVQAWNSAGPFSAKDLGRSASKFEGLQDMLLACQEEWKGLQESGAPASEALFGYAAPFGVLPVEPGRLNFVGEPSFDPVPFLDSQNRATYQRPLDYARDLEAEEAVPRVAVRADARQTKELLDLLDRTGRLRLFAKDEVRPRLRNGLFSVAKDHARDRMVLDARPPNLVECTENRWIRSLGTLEQFQFIYLPPECDFEIHTEDLKEFLPRFCGVRAKGEEERLCSRALLRRSQGAFCLLPSPPGADCCPRTQHHGDGGPERSSLRANVPFSRFAEKREL